MMLDNTKLIKTNVIIINKGQQAGGIKEMTNLHLIMTNFVGNGILVRDPLTDIRLRNYWPCVSYLKTLIEPDRKL